jgi:uncharacterized protein YjiS (DUF1127 family)
MTRFTDFEKAMLDLAKMQAPSAPTRKSITLADLGAALVESLRRPWRRTQLAFELGRLDERMLADIGMKRHEITDVAYKASRESVPSFGELVAQYVAAAYKRHQLRRELNSLDDRLLADIGISRADIPAVVAMMGAAPASQDGETFDPIASIRVWNRSRETARTLASMDDRQLTDMGFVRGDIDWVAEELAIRSLWPANRDTAPKAA